MTQNTTGNMILRKSSHLLLTCLFLVSFCSTLLADWREDIGYTKLSNAFQGSPPDGSGVHVSVVEAEAGGLYFPDGTNSEFTAATDPYGQAVNFIDGSPDKTITGTSDHATDQVINFLIGNSGSVAPGANQATIFEANDFLNNYLPDVATMSAPDFSIQNHSWVGSVGSNSNDRHALRRLDYMIDEYEVTTAVGLHPSNSSAHEPLFTFSYNAIAVGRPNGRHSRGQTSSFYGGGRIKPDIVVPELSTISSATAALSSAAALLHDIADGTDATRSEVTKAILLAGATKEEFSNFVDTKTGAVNPWERTTTQPLDDILGAGQLNIFNSYLMLLEGQTAGSTSTAPLVSKNGWDYKSSITPSQEVQYDFEIPAGSTAKELSIVLAWNVDVSASLNSHSLANLDLELVDSTGMTVDESISTVDNVEHIYLTDLEAGTYTLKVSSNSVRDFGIAWRTTTLFDEPSADFNEDGSVNGFDFLTWQLGLGTLVNATRADGDADGDGDVDGDDLAIFTAAVGGGPSPSELLAIPEPTSLILALAGLLLIFVWQKRSSYSLGR